MSQRWSATGAWGGKPIGRVRVNLKSSFSSSKLWRNRRLSYKQYIVTTLWSKKQYIVPHSAWHNLSLGPCPTVLRENVFYDVVEDRGSNLVISWFHVSQGRSSPSAFNFEVTKKTVLVGSGALMNANFTLRTNNSTFSLISIKFQEVKSQVIISKRP